MIYFLWHIYLAIKTTSYNLYCYFLFYSSNNATKGSICFDICCKDKKEDKNNKVYVVFYLETKYYEMSLLFNVLSNEKSGEWVVNEKTGVLSTLVMQFATGKDKLLCNILEYVIHTLLFIFWIDRNHILYTRIR